MREINDYLNGFISLDECKELINIKTRQYAKRQNTWSRGHMKNWNKLYSKDFAVLLKKIYKRTNIMFKNKCIKEVEKFNLIKLNKTFSANKLIGVREINEYLLNSISLDKCKGLINIKTRQYAKRQKTWARGHMSNWNKLYSKDFAVLLKKVLKLVS